ncbi:MAG: acylphosphatase [Rhodoferax sp.]|nr:acylphosphatase [Rhodoferax sp.]
MDPETVCQHLFISGHVQGVYFRASLESTARTLQLAGWVRNRRDGRVEAMVQGPAAAVESLVQWCHQGPPAARVDAVQATARPVDPTLVALHCVATA